MNNDFIIKYKVFACSSSPTGGDKPLRRFDALEEAIDYAKEISGKDLYVLKMRYTDERNVERDFHFNYSLAWASYL